VHRNFIDGSFVEHAGAEPIEVLNPASGKVISEIPNSPASAVQEAVAAAKRAQRAWGKRPAIERASFLRAIASRIREKDKRDRTFTISFVRLLD